MSMAKFHAKDEYYAYANCITQKSIPRVGSASNEAVESWHIHFFLPPQCQKERKVFHDKFPVGANTDRAFILPWIASLQQD
jgi:hypothetical protein